MKYTIDEIHNQKAGVLKCKSNYDRNECDEDFRCRLQLRLIETIEAQQQEIGQLKNEKDIQHKLVVRTMTLNVAMKDVLKNVESFLRIIDESGGEWESGTACEALAEIEKLLQEESK